MGVGGVGVGVGGCHDKQHSVSDVDGRLVQMLLLEIAAGAGARGINKSPENHYQP